MSRHTAQQALNARSTDPRASASRMAFAIGWGTSVDANVSNAPAKNEANPSPHRAVLNPRVRARTSVSHPPERFAIPAHRNGRPDSNPPLSAEKPSTRIKYVGTHVTYKYSP